MTHLAIGLAITVVVLIPLAVMCWLAATAPLGFEDDERGFVYGEPDEHSHPDNMGV